MRFVKQKLKTGEIIVLDKKYHRYYLENNKSHIFKPSTTFVNKFFPKFDSDRISKNYAKKHKLKQKDVLADWSNKGKVSRKTGDKCHLYVENYFKKKKLPKPVGEREINLFRVISRLIKVLENEFVFFKAEFLVASLIQNIAGMIDILMINGSHLHILDIKTCKEIDRSNRWQNALMPIEHLEDCNYNKYSLQLNLYRGMIKAYFEDRFSDYVPSIIHITEDDYEIIEVPNMTNELRSMIEWE